MNKTEALQAEIFRQAGFASGQESTGISVFLGFFKLIATGDMSTPAQQLA